ncbi:MAG: FHA domain-containing protein [Planctomycetota bacterium]
MAYIHLPGGAGLELRPGERLEVGRSESCHVRIQSSQVSRQHAEILWNEGKSVPFVVDMGSQNGTTLEGKPLKPYEPHPLHDGASLKVANHRLRIELFLPADSDVYLNDKQKNVSVFWDDNDVQLNGTLGVDLALREIFELIESRRLSGTLLVDHGDRGQTRAIFCLGRLFDAHSPTASGVEAILELRRAAGSTVSFTAEFEPTSKAFDLRATDVLLGRANAPRRRDDDQTERWGRP